MKINFNIKHTKKYHDTLQSVLSYAISHLGIESDVEVNLYEVSPRQIKKINKEFRDVDKVTDVLSFPNLLEVGMRDMQLITDKISKENFPFDINPETNNIMLGDIYINYHQAKKQAKKFQNTLEREICYLCVHSLLHLLGYDHMKDSDKKIMRAKEEEILDAFSIKRNI